MTEPARDQRDHDTAALVDELVDYFQKEAGGLPGGVSLPDGAGPAQRREVLAALLTVRPPSAIPGPIQATLDTLLDAEAAVRPVVEATTLTTLAASGITGPLGQVVLWQGDITTLRVDAIVNAANSQMLGCFVPGHRCIDNAIHAAAGPGLREECNELVIAQGHLEPTGSAQLAGGYHLPATHVIHTVGPIVADHEPTPEHAALLASCYQACLEVARRAGDRSIAFCSISTGVFGYPILDAARVALTAIEGWLVANPDVGMLVVIDTFSDRDTAAYRQAFVEHSGA
ncbi:O-acetyl-ADP-ribose deacetylase (regulator of RNase III), contains Macro domain [Sanguibacter gelidistatuariae]|uniref:Protein-ADP-ribose hydrolase n=1 Tax=Sanguibacter gelidistatuariae TaxID=1814289 RepID=A0A1G6HGF2_9MICO|nr:protein-ADP-ribose hydrolase [Sanguibacter gelidistatuariae]SDB93198.1 O-acetyl-ADP-ribose deacetylase (regulator of RNase III), contains Macro domain [Sanguibacter gelidistatuariae]